MADVTLGQINERLKIIDDLQFRMATGQIPGTAEEYERLTSEGDHLMEVLAKAIGDIGPHDYQSAWNARHQVRQLTRLALITTRHAELRPNEDPEFNALVQAAMANGATDEDNNRLMQSFSYMFVELPRTSDPSWPIPIKGFFQRMFRR